MMLLMAGVDTIEFPRARQFAMAYLLARHDIGIELSLPITMTPLNPCVGGVFRFYLLTSG